MKIAIDPVRLDQTHSSIAHRINNKIQGLVGDALVTCTINLPCSIDVADCVPVFLCDETGTEISAIHAGWRGLLAGVIENTTKILTAPLSKVNAWIGPAISAEVYSVGEELRELFRLKDPSYLSFFSEIDNRIYFDLREAVKYTIIKVGISSIAQTSRCVYLEDKSFFSYRREKTRERMTGIIWISGER